MKGPVRTKSNAANKWNGVLFDYLQLSADYLLQWGVAYQAIEEYQSLASGGTWDNAKGADIKDNVPVSKAFWEGYMKSPVSKFHSSF